MYPNTFGPRGFSVPPGDPDEDPTKVDDPHDHKNEERHDKCHFDRSCAAVEMALASTTRGSGRKFKSHDCTSHIDYLKGGFAVASLNNPLTDKPKATTATTITTAINPTMSAYSTAVAPRSPRTKNP
jgi:hypothetical protein